MTPDDQAVQLPQTAPEPQLNHSLLECELEVHRLKKLWMVLAEAILGPTRPVPTPAVMSTIDLAQEASRARIALAKWREGTSTSPPAGPPSP